MKNEDRGIFLAVALVLLSCGPIQRASTAPKVFTSPDGSFSVTSPFDFSETTKILNRATGPVKQVVFFGGDDVTLYTVFYHDYPDSQIRPSAQTALDENRTAIVDALYAMHGRIVSEKSITLGDYPGRDLILDAIAPSGPTVAIYLRSMLVGNRVYGIEVVVQKGKYDAHAIADFLESFKIIKN